MAHSPVSTPWGPSQTAQILYPGITFYTTASHGGARLSPDRFAEFQKQFPGLATWAGGPWFEEDCDVALVMVTFPDLFQNSLNAALKSLEMFHDESPVVKEWLAGEHAARVRRIAAAVPSPAEEFDAAMGERILRID